MSDRPWWGHTDLSVNWTSFVSLGDVSQQMKNGELAFMIHSCKERKIFTVTFRKIAASKKKAFCPCSSIHSISANSDRTKPPSTEKSSWLLIIRTYSLQLWFMKFAVKWTNTVHLWSQQIPRRFPRWESMGGLWWLRVCSRRRSRQYRNSITRTTGPGPGPTTQHDHEWAGAIPGSRSFIQEDEFHSILKFSPHPHCMPLSPGTTTTTSGFIRITLRKHCTECTGSMQWGVLARSLRWTLHSKWSNQSKERYHLCSSSFQFVVCSLDRLYPFPKEYLFPENEPFYPYPVVVHPIWILMINSFIFPLPSSCCYRNKEGTQRQQR